jgi:hypothetical protein
MTGDFRNAVEGYAGRQNAIFEVPRDVGRARPDEAETRPNDVGNGLSLNLDGCAA